MTAIRGALVAQLKRLGVLRPTLAALTLFSVSQAHAAQPAWPPAVGSQQPQATTPGWFPFAQPAPSQPPQGNGFPFPWMSSGSAGTSAPPWSHNPQPANPFAPQPAFNPFNPMAGIGGMGNMGMMMAPMMQGMMGFMAPMMTNYAIASMNPTTMSNFFGLMANPGGGMGMMPFGGFGFPGSGFGTPGYSYQNQAPGFPWSRAPANPWSQTPGSFGAKSNRGPAFPPFFPFFTQGTR
ncbi:MAG: hypothetical protein Kow006_02260 [Gammaproteobacteria bacterium]